MFQSAANNVTITNGVNENAPTVWGRDPRNPDGSGSGTFESDGIGAFCGWASSNSGHLAYSFQLSGWYAHGMYQRGTHGLALDGIWDGVRVDHNWVYNSVKGGGQNLAYSSIYTPPNCSGSGECNWDRTHFSDDELLVLLNQQQLPGLPISKQFDDLRHAVRWQ